MWNILDTLLNSLQLLIFAVISLHSESHVNPCILPSFNFWQSKHRWCELAYSVTGAYWWERWLLSHWEVLGVTLVTPLSTGLEYMHYLLKSIRLFYTTSKSQAFVYILRLSQKRSLGRTSFWGLQLICLPLLLDVYCCCHMRWLGEPGLGLEAETREEKSLPFLLAPECAFVKPNQV